MRQWGRLASFRLGFVITVRLHANRRSEGAGSHQKFCEGPKTLHPIILTAGEKTFLSAFSSLCQSLQKAAVSQKHWGLCWTLTFCERSRKLLTRSLFLTTTLNDHHHLANRALRLLQFCIFFLILDLILQSTSSQFSHFTSFVFTVCSFVPCRVTL